MGLTALDGELESTDGVVVDGVVDGRFVELESKFKKKQIKHYHIFGTTNTRATHIVCTDEQSSLTSFLTSFICSCVQC